MRRSQRPDATNGAVRATCSPLRLYPHQLADLLASVQPPRRLSLDCFDTLLWRRTAAPTDVFFDLQHRPAFAARGLNCTLRVRAEERARRLQWTRRGSREVLLSDIYRAAFADLADDEVETLAADELAAEMHACFALPAAVELLRDAAHRGIPVMIVSDTYLTRDQLRRLLEHCVPADAMAAIDRIVCSSEHGVSKSAGLFRRVLERLSTPAHAVLHVGDNELADVQAAVAAGLRAAHLCHLDDHVAGLERMQATALALAEPSVRSSRGLQRPYHAVLAAGGPLNTPAVALGYAAMGPLMHAFASYVLGERAALQSEGRRPKLLFLMRDAHLPRHACEVLAGEPVGHPVRISRFAAFAASFRRRADVEAYLADFANADYLDVMARQLLLPQDKAAALLAKARAATNPVGEFTRQVLRDDTLGIIVTASAAYRRKLRRYLERVADIRAGDTLVLVDLGYQGTAQRLLQPVFRDEWGIDVVGRYLLASRAPGWEHARGGLIDPSWCDDRAIASIVPYVAVLENLCTSGDASVIDYGEDGEPILDRVLIDDGQRRSVEAVQEAALRFVEDARRCFERIGAPTSDALRQAALGELARLIFFPAAHELDLLASFELDMNLGTHDKLKLLDVERGASAMRSRGVFALEQDLSSKRLLQPAEMHAAGMELSLSLLAQHRFGLEIGANERSLRREVVRVLLMRGEQSTQDLVQAQHTHDGWFALLIPIAGAAVHSGIAFGERYRHVQIDAVTLVPLADLYTQRESRHSRDVVGAVTFDRMHHLGQGLYECLDETSLVIVPPVPRADVRFVLRVVFRPIVYRDDATQPASGAPATVSVDQPSGVIA